VSGSPAANIDTQRCDTQRWTSAPIMDPWPGPLIGAYLLLIDVTRPCALVFGRYNGGRPVVVQSGQILYIGSAGGSPQQPRLAQRILRHLTRSAGAPPHWLREPFAAYCRQTSEVAPPRSKRLRWHIDYLLDLPDVSVSAVWMARGGRIGEEGLYTALHATGHTLPVAPGLGASDHRRATHLLYSRNSTQTLQQTFDILCQ
jgi:Uri superfamily endonuclease